MENKIGIVVALDGELERVVEKLVCYVVKTKIPFKTYMGVYKGNHIIVVVSGTGKINAANATSYLINKYKPVKVINVGVCGATAEAFNTSQTLILGEFCPELEIGRVIEKDYDTSAVDGENFKRNEIISVSNSKYPLFTADHFTTQSKEDGYFDMEGYAVAQTCLLYDTRVVLVKSVTDIIDSGEQKTQYECNFDTACSRAVEGLNYALDTNYVNVTNAKQIE